MIRLWRVIHLFGKIKRPAQSMLSMEFWRLRRFEPCSDKPSRAGLHRRGTSLGFKRDRTRQKTAPAAPCQTTEAPRPLVRKGDMTCGRSLVSFSCSCNASSCGPAGACPGQAVGDDVRVKSPHRHMDHGCHKVVGLPEGRLSTMRIKSCISVRSRNASSGWPCGQMTLGHRAQPL